MQTSWRPEFVTDSTSEAEVDAADEVAAARAASVVAEQPARLTMSRALRDLEAAKARVERDAQRAQDQMREQLVTQLLPVLDNLDRTLAIAAQHGDAPTVVEGAALVRRQLAGVLEGYGVTRIDARDKLFDPALHEAISVVPVEPRHDRRVVEQIEAGYAMGERLLRAAKVVVGRARSR